MFAGESSSQTMVIATGETGASGGYVKKALKLLFNLGLDDDNKMGLVAEGC
ncbi:hypothetical protein HanRHA438_Chr06g0270871 [Helianthus annuus]|nr:hypothetical protein HanRHA438_Chr06g0270871 [Helianthus annuus]